MNSIFSFTDDGDDNQPSKLNLDDLFERKQKKDLETVGIYNQILRRIHNKIKVASRSTNDQHIWFVVPEVIMGITRYDHGECTAYLITKLRENDLVVRYTHPNLLFVSWGSWVPGYVRTEMKKKAGINVDGRGNPITVSKEGKDSDSADPNAILLGGASATTKDKPKDEFRSIGSYKPSGRLVYDQDLFKRIHDKSS
jgi:hypothetical protein